MDFQEEGISSAKPGLVTVSIYDVINAGILANEWELARVKIESNHLEPRHNRISLGPRASPQWLWPAPVIVRKRLS